jgi:hypothetical protein
MAKTKKKPADKPKEKIPAYEKYMAPDFEARNEKELILSIKSLYRHEQQSMLPTYWHIGKIVCAYCKKKKYGNEQIEKIEDETGIKGSTLTKCRTFAKKYEEKDLKALLKSKDKFLMSWHLIAQNLTLESEQLIEAYENSTTKSEFCNSVTELKDAIKKNTKKTKPTDEQPEDEDDDTATEDDEDTGDETDDDEDDTDTEDKTDDDDDPNYVTSEELGKKSEEAKSIMKLNAELKTLKEMVRGVIKDTENRKSIFKLIKKIGKIIGNTEMSPSRHPISAQN